MCLYSYLILEIILKQGKFGELFLYSNTLFQYSFSKSLMTLQFQIPWMNSFDSFTADAFSAYKINLSDGPCLNTD